MAGARRTTSDRNSPRSAFTLVEVLAALALMAIIIPVAMEGVQIASRAGTLGERKATAARIAESVLNGWSVTGQALPATSTGSATENGLTYLWSIKTDTWPEDAMGLATARVSFVLQGNTYDVSVSTLYDPTSAATTGVRSSTAAPTSP